MRILGFRGENYKRLRFVQLKIKDGQHIVAIKGENEQGKSSVLSAVAAVLNYKDKSVKPTAPVQTGQEIARVALELGDTEVEMIAERTFRLVHEDGKPPWEYTTDLKLTDVEGGKFDKPATRLEDLLGALTFDPSVFHFMSPEDQFALLGESFCPDINFDQLERLYERDYALRTNVNKRAEEARSLYTGLVVPADPPCIAVDKTALVAALTEAGEKNADIEQRRANRERIGRQVQSLNAEATTHTQRANDLQQRIDELLAQQAQERQQAAAKIARANQLDAALRATAPPGPPIDTAALVNKIALADADNERLASWARDRDRKAQLLANWQALVDESKALTKQMDDREADKNARIAAAKMPVAGLGFGRRCVLYKGLPFSEAADSVRMRVSVAIAMSMSPKLRVILIRYGNLFTRKHLQIVYEMAKEHDYDIWIELVGEDGPAGFILEDGMLKLDETAASPPIAA